MTRANDACCRLSTFSQTSNKTCYTSHNKHVETGDGLTLSLSLTHTRTPTHIKGQ